MAKSLSNSPANVTLGDSRKNISIRTKFDYTRTPRAEYIKEKLCHLPGFIGPGRVPRTSIRPYIMQTKLNMMTGEGSGKGGKGSGKGGADNQSKKGQRRQGSQRRSRK